MNTKNLLSIEEKLTVMIAAGFEIYLTEEGRQRILDALPEAVEEGAAAHE